MKRDLVTLSDLSPQHVIGLLDLAQRLKDERIRGIAEPLLAGKHLAMLFEKPSLRTRTSFDIAMVELGGHALYLGPEEVQLGRRESVADVARVLSHYVDAIMARVFAHEHIVALAHWASVPVINGLSDYCHPCQALADLLTIREKLGRLDGVRLTYVGDGNNVVTSLLFAAALTGMSITVATPPGYEPATEVVERAKELATHTGTRIDILTDPTAAVMAAHVIYTDTWTSMGQESEADERRRAFAGYQVNADLLAHAPEVKGVMHCLPAHRGQEITDQVADGPLSWLFDQAENRLHAQKAVLVDLMT